MVSKRHLRRAGRMTEERWSCRAFCAGCNARVYSADRLPASSKPDVERLLLWLREHVGKEHREKHPGCIGLKLRWTWTLLVEGRRESA
jgi:hypothetical protein